MKMCKTHLASLLKHKLILQQEVRTPDGLGGYVRTWQEVTTLWGSIMPISGREKLYAKQLQEEVTHKISVRFLNKIDANMRLLHQSRVFNIRSIQNDAEENKTLTLFVSEGDF